METLKEQEDAFATIVKLCKPTTSQEAKFRDFPFVRESEDFAESNPGPYSSSPDPTPSEAPGILMVSPPNSANSINQQVEDEAVYHTPPEHHVSNLYSSEDQNLDDLCAEGLRTVHAGDRSDRQRKIRVLEGQSDDEFESKRIRIQREELDGETVPVGETEAIVVDNQGNVAISDTKVIVLDSADSLDTISEDGVEVSTVDVVQSIGEFMKDGMPEVDAIDGNHELGEKCKSMKDFHVNKGENSNENSNLSGSLDSSKIEEEIVKLKCILEYGCTKRRQASGVGVTEEVVKVAEEGKMPKHGNGDGGPRTHPKRTEEIDDFHYIDGGDGEMRQNGTTGGDSSAGRRQLPASMKEKEKNVRAGERKSGLLEFLHVLKVVVEDMDGGEDVNFLETAKRRGLVLPRARWWVHEVDDE
ncbi:UNVERIFIED_CONTAM: hypothetical protein Sindi_0556200 [Sesamum indicum]